MTDIHQDTKPAVSFLNNRQLIAITGEDRYDFLQGLITNDIYKLQEKPLIYSCFLTAQGKYLYDFFIFEQDETLFLDCHQDQALDFSKKLKLYKLRSKVQLSFLDGSLDNQVLVLFNADKKLGYPDPRSDAMGQRLYFKKLEDTGAYERIDYDLQRFQNGVPEGGDDLLSGKTTMLEARMDELGAVDFKKGCYIGQELTARTHYRGLVKKKLFVFSFKGDAPAINAKIVNADGKSAGEARSTHSAGYGFALMRLDSEPQNNEFTTETGQVIYFAQ